MFVVIVMLAVAEFAHHVLLTRCATHTIESCDLLREWNVNRVQLKLK